MTDRIVIMAGGTGGHIFPGLALAEQMQNNGWLVDWIGTADRMEADIVPKYGHPIHFINVKGVRGNGLKRLLGAPLMLLKAFLQARRILKTLSPNVVVGFGGYASGPGGLAAWSLGIPLIIHEQNAVTGMTNKWLAKVAEKTLLGFANAQSSLSATAIEVVGNPVRVDICKLGEHTKPAIEVSKPLNVLVIGGSLGARALNQSLPTIFAEVAAQRPLSVRHQVGKGNVDSVLQAYAPLTTNEVLAVSVLEFISDMPDSLAWSDLVICRAGALTVAELAASGNAGVFVPLPIAVDDHQTKNAEFLADQGAAVIIQQSELNHRLASELLRLSLSSQPLLDMQAKARQLGQPHAAQRIAEVCMEYGSK